VRRPGVAAGLALATLAIVAAACGGTAPSTGPGGSAATTGTPATPAPTAAISPGLPPTVAPTSEPAITAPPAETVAPPSPAGPVVEDPSLLEILPADIGGVAIAYEPEAFADAAADMAFAQSVETAAFAVVFDGEDLASAVVALLAPGTYSDDFFRDWRDSYNDGACAQAGGVVGNAETEIDGQTIHIGTCAGGLRTYHAWLEARGVLVSAFSLGDRRFGEQLMAGLRP
jgi:hypothetical protein